jgi:mannosyl-3-phosphoglycerate phosphatase
LPGDKGASIRYPVIFTDLDGTLLDHDTYSWEPAAATLAELRRRRIPVILSSSKTLRELDTLRDALRLPDPVIAENGAIVDVPRGYFAQGLPQRDSLPERAKLQQVYRAVKSRFGFACRAFFELGEAGIAEVTGLDLPAASRANQRRATEPVLWEDTAERLAAFCGAVEAGGLRCVKGGRFVHLMGNADKAGAMTYLLAAFAREWPDRSFTSIALGDGPNDAAMLAAADIAVIVRGRHDEAIDLGDHPRVLRTHECGPVGWKLAIRELLEL